MASKASTKGYVAGAGPPAYSPPVAATKSRTCSSVTACGAVGGNVRPTSDWSTGMAPKIARDPPGCAGRVSRDVIVADAVSGSRGAPGACGTGGRTSPAPDGRGRCGG